MKTSIVFDDDVAAAIRARVRSGKTLREVVNDALRRCFARDHAAPLPTDIKTFSSQYQQGIDTTRLNELIDELDAQQFIEKQSREN